MLLICGSLHGTGSWKTTPSGKPIGVNPEMSLVQAQQDVLAAMRNLWNLEYFDYRDVRVTDEYLKYSVKRIRHGFRDQSGEYVYVFKDSPYFGTPDGHILGYWSVRSPLEPYKNNVLCWKSEDTAERFVAAINRLIWEHSPEGAARRIALERRIADWKAKGAKVELPEEAERHKVLAVAAFNDKDFQRAADEYIAGLKVYPMWPEGEFNVALLFGDSLHRYSDAVQHMNHYLELMPNAPNAEDAKHKLWIWQDRESRQ